LKKPSDTRFPTPPEITFFTDRDLGKLFPRILRESGLSVVRYGDHFGERNAPDDEWIAFAASRKLIALSHDRNIRSDPVAIRAAMESHARLFIVRGKHLTGSEKANLVLGAMGQIYRHVEEQPAAFIAVIRRMSLAGGILKPDVRIRLTFAEWKQGRQPPPETEELPL
jgi:hypothetical protein